jgi:signal transduction histidine kinase
MIALTRLVLAASGLIIIFLVPSEPDRFVIPTYTSLVLYTLYSIGAYVAELRGRPVRVISEWGHWIDVGCYTVLITLSRGTNSIFFFGYFLPILVASFRWGFVSGLRVAVLSTALFVTPGYLVFSPQDPDFELQRSLIRPVYLLTFGYMIAYWGGYEIELKRRLELLRDVATISNPRFGVDRTLGGMLHRLRSYFDADGCALILNDASEQIWSLRRVRRLETEQVARAEAIPEGVAKILLGLHPGSVVRYGGSRTGWWRRGSAASSAFDATTGESVALDPRIRETISDTLDARSFLTVPLRVRNRVAGRLYLTGEGQVRFNESNARFLLHVMEQALPVVDNLRLVSQLASAAADEERRKIARDIHDSVIQPYIGLQIGLAGVRQKLAASGNELSADVQRLIDMTSLGIEDLRRQVLALRAGSEADGRLVPAVKRFAARFSEVTGIAVDVEAETDWPLEDRLAAEAFQMVAEGLSNIRRHTQAAHATIRLAVRNGCLELRIENEASDGPCAEFTPRSITERAAALGGAADVRTNERGATVITVEVPL